MSANREKKTEKKVERGSAKAGSPPLLFVDAVENGRARLLLGREAFEVPAALLPQGAREGSWLRWSLALAPAPPDDDQAAALRAKLGRGDDGGDIDL
jgi:hypothetical protein